MTRAEYLKEIEDLLLEQGRRVSSSKEEADKLIESLGIAHLFVPMKKTTRKKPGAKRTVPKKEVSKK